MSEYVNEPVRGLPAVLPAGEHIVWQGSPSLAPFARRVFHTHLVAGYFAILIGWAGLGIATGHRTLATALPGIATTLAVGAVAVALLTLFAWLSARATIYTITNRRVVLRFGVALPKCVNLPFGQIAAAGLQVHADRSGDIPLGMTATRLGFIHLWPNVRPWRVGRPEPMLRGLREPEAVADLLAAALAAAVPGRRAVAMPSAIPDFAPAGSLAA